MTNFGDVGQFQHKFGLPSVIHDGGPAPVDLEDPDVQERLQERFDFMKEELEEYRLAWHNDDIVEMADALVDLVYVAMGTAHRLGLPWEALWTVIHTSNMRKVRAADRSESKRNSPVDVIKPPDWQPPDLRTILRKYGWDV
jgi:hypothetical protein